ncbi:serine/threonine-protein phosphatase [Methanothermococcus sp. SCGC AD-155-C09]|nr:serine/threonine-protein phosphatase [Methanothermococcus sp. SCGC AD-155-C09]
MKNNSKVKFSFLSEKGIREKNEDAYLAEKIGKYYAFAIADGMGGHTHGEKASKIAITELKETLKRFNEEPEDLLKRAFEKANREILAYSEIVGTSMGTTLVACLLNEEGEVVIANIGDSRAHIINDGVWHTKDHSYVQELLDSNIIDEKEAKKHPRKNIITRALGMEERVKPDLYRKKLKGTLVLCSDGLHDYVEDEDIAKIVKSYKPEEACRNLIKLALKSSNDNITVIVVSLE